MKSFLVILLFPLSSFAQQNFWTSLLINKCQQARPTCQAHLNAGCKQSGTFKIGSSSSFFNGYCEQVTEGGGWLLVKRVAPAVDAPTNSWNTKLAVTSNVGSVGPEINGATDYNLAHSSYPVSYTRYLMQRYKNSPSYVKSNIISFDFNQPFTSFSTTSWVTLSNVKFNGSPTIGTLRNRTTGHIYSGTCGTGADNTPGSGELGICISNDTSVSTFWGTNFNSDLSKSRMISYYTTSLNTYWDPSVGLWLFIK